MTFQFYLNVLIRGTLTSIVLQIALVILPAASLTAQEFSGSLTTEGRFFFQNPLHQEQRDHNGSLAILPEYYHAFADSSSITIAPFLRLDTADSKRNSFDIRELSYLTFTDTWELQIGISKVFWGVTEFVHLVDIINQSDQAESMDGEEKLGQPMVHLSLLREWGVVELFALPYFRQRTFPGINGRLRSSLLIDQDHPLYESRAEEHHLDMAIRYSHTIGNLDFGLSHFQGTNREPTLLPELNKQGQIILTPYYEQISQTGIDLQLISGEWLLKLESTYRTGQGELNFWAATGGIEYTITGVADTNMDLGIIAEYVYDDRSEQATTIFNNDLMAGFRLAVNNAASSEILAGFMTDLDTASQIVTVEASHRLNDNLKAILEVGIFSNIPEDDLLFSIRDDDYIRIELSYYY